MATASTIVKFCTCFSNYQDKKYGKGNRLHNLTRKEGARCTVCGNPPSSADIKKKDFIKSHIKAIHG